MQVYVCICKGRERSKGKAATIKELAREARAGLAKSSQSHVSRPRAM